ncbi:MAG: hypothetical protein AB7G68_12735 [Nitrospiraceae bacterium]
MKLIAPELGRVVVLFPGEDIRPLHGLHPPDVFTKIRARYGFQYTPDMTQSWEQVQKDGFKFQLGKFPFGDTSAPIREFAIYNDGVVATALSTEIAEAFLQDAFSWAKESLKLSELSRPARTIYVSNVIVELEGSIDDAIIGLEAVSQQLNDMLKSYYGVEAPVHLTSLTFQYDLMRVPQWQNMVPFSITRRVGHPFEHKRYFSEAPLKSLDHIEFLKTFENKSTLQRGSHVGS